jgi:uncharacterized protein (TIGR00297 family)
MTLYVPDPGLVVGGLVITLATAGAARFFGLVSSTGFYAGLTIGGWVSLGLGSPGLAVVGAFFVLGSIATRWRYAEKEKRGVAEPGGGARGAGRVLAKGCVGAALAVAAIFGDFDPVLVRAGFVGAFAAAAADTLGTEIGQVVGKRPFTIVPWGPARPGTPGAVSVDGLLAGFLGASVVSACAALAGHDLLPPVAALPVAAAGLLGSVVEAAMAPLLRRVPQRDLAANLVTTAAGAALAAATVALLFRGAA